MQTQFMHMLMITLYERCLFYFWSNSCFFWHWMWRIIARAFNGKVQDMRIAKVTIALSQSVQRRSYTVLALQKHFSSDLEVERSSQLLVGCWPQYQLYFHRKWIFFKSFSNLCNDRNIVWHQSAESVCFSLFLYILHWYFIVSINYRNIFSRDAICYQLYWFYFVWWNNRLLYNFLHDATKYQNANFKV